jgi:predicted ArsR family transcriptional regulator
MNKNTKNSKSTKIVKKASKIEGRKPGRPMLNITLPKGNFTVAQIVGRRSVPVSAVAVHNHVKRAIDKKFAKKVENRVKGQGHPTYVFTLTAKGISHFHGGKVAAKKITKLPKAAKVEKAVSVEQSMAAVAA